ncbi:MAG: outer membrane beta-barrel protein [Bacteroidota bacterium]|nr:outer membrane beta-barrel protein [Bacteroidota bacterium]
MIKDNNIDELFRNKLLNHEQEPPAYILQNILVGAAGARRKRKMVFWRVAGIAAAVLLAFVAGWQLNDRSGELAVQPTSISQNSKPEMNSKKVIDEFRKEPNQISQTQNSPEITNHSAANKTLLVVSRFKNERQITTPKTAVFLQTDETEVIKPLKRLTRLIKQEDRFAGLLLEKKIVKTSKEQEELSIDQQIMNQNKEMMLAQDESQKKTRWLVGAQVSPAYSVSRSSHSQVYASNMLSSSSNKPVELGGGVSVEVKSGKRWSLQSGVYYSALGQTSGNTTSSSGKNLAMADNGSKYFNAPVNIEANTSKMNMNSSAGVIEFSSIPSGIVLGTNLEANTMVSAVVVSDASFIQNFEYIEIPLYLRYTILDSRFDVELLGGISSNLLIGNQTFMESSNIRSLVGKTNDMQSLNYSGTLGIGLKYGLSKRIFLNVEPRIKYFLNSLNSNSDVSYKPYTIGVYSGLSYEF